MDWVMVILGLVIAVIGVIGLFGGFDDWLGPNY